MERPHRPWECLHALPLIDKARERRLHLLIPRETPRFAALYRRRAAVEREFERLENEWALSPLRVRGVERVRLHADLTILAELACAVTRTRAIPALGWVPVERRLLAVARSIVPVLKRSEPVARRVAPVVAMLAWFVPSRDPMAHSGTQIPLTGCAISFLSESVALVGLVTLVGFHAAASSHAARVSFPTFWLETYADDSEGSWTFGSRFARRS